MVSSYRTTIRSILTSLSYRCFLLLTVMFLSFSIARIAPGNPCKAALLKDNEDRVQQAKICHELYLDRSVATQFYLLGKQMLTGELRSWRQVGRPRTSGLVIAALKNSLPIIAFVTLLVWTLSFPIGIGCAIRQGSQFDRVVNALLTIILSTPTFLLAYLVVYLLGVQTHRPFVGQYSIGVAESSSGMYIADRFWHISLPSIAIALGAVAFLSQYVRAQFIEVKHQQYIDLARLRGINEMTITYRHILRNTLLPVITLLGLYFPWIVGGSLAVELVFAWPGIGRLAYDSSLQRDYPVMLTVNFVTALTVFFGSTVADFLYRIVDPRTKTQGE